jgi:hypothetical protein
LYQQIPHKTCCSQLGKFLRQPCLLFEQFLFLFLLSNCFEKTLFVQQQQLQPEQV